MKWDQREEASDLYTVWRRKDPTSRKFVQEEQSCKDCGCVTAPDSGACAQDEIPSRGAAGPGAAD